MKPFLYRLLRDQSPFLPDDSRDFPRPRSRFTLRGSRTAAPPPTCSTHEPRNAAPKMERPAGSPARVALRNARSHLLNFVPAVRRLRFQSSRNWRAGMVGL